MTRGKRFLPLVALVLGLGLLVPMTASANGCVDCHGKLDTDGRIDQRHQDYDGSLHASKGIGCDSCHGGDARAGAADKAHAGVLPASNEKSRVYFKNVPRTCGRCHGGQFERFAQSRHGEQLAASGKGPNCVTCHGSMATRILRADQVEEFCSTCHNERVGAPLDKPREAADTLALMARTRLLVEWAGDFGAGNGTSGGPSLERAGNAMAMAMAAWHTFDLGMVKQYLDTAAQAAQAAKTEAGR